MSSNGGHDPGAETGPRQATPFTRVYYWLFLVVGISLLIGGLTPWRPAVTLTDLHDWKAWDLYGLGVDWGAVLHIVLGIFITSGAIYSLLGAQYRTWINDSWRYERTGALLGAAGWAVFTLAVGYEKPSSLIDLLFPFSSAVSLIVRYITLGGREKYVRTAYHKKIQENSQ